MLEDSQQTGMWDGNSMLNMSCRVGVPAYWLTVASICGLVGCGASGGTRSPHSSAAVTADGVAEALGTAVPDPEHSLQRQLGQWNCTGMGCYNPWTQHCAPPPPPAPNHVCQQGVWDACRDDLRRVAQVELDCTRIPPQIHGQHVSLPQGSAQWRGATARLASVVRNVVEREISRAQACVRTADVQGTDAHHASYANPYASGTQGASPSQPEYANPYTSQSEGAPPSEPARTTRGEQFTAPPWCLVPLIGAARDLDTYMSRSAWAEQDALLTLIWPDAADLLRSDRALQARGAARAAQHCAVPAGALEIDAERYYSSPDCNERTLLGEDRTRLSTEFSRRRLAQQAVATWLTSEEELASIEARDYRSWGDVESAYGSLVRITATLAPLTAHVARVRVTAVQDAVRRSRSVLEHAGHTWARVELERRLATVLRSLANAPDEATLVLALAELDGIMRDVEQRFVLPLGGFADAFRNDATTRAATLRQNAEQRRSRLRAEAAAAEAAREAALEHEYRVQETIARWCSANTNLHNIREVQRRQRLVDQRTGTRDVRVARSLEAAAIDTAADQATAAQLLRSLREVVPPNCAVEQVY